MREANLFQILEALFQIVNETNWHLSSVFIVVVVDRVVDVIIACYIVVHIVSRDFGGPDERR